MARGRKGSVVTLEGIKEEMKKAENNTQLQTAFGKIAMISISQDDFGNLANLANEIRETWKEKEQKEMLEKAKANEANEEKIAMILESIIVNVFGLSAGELFRKLNGFPRIGLVLKHLECGARAAMLVK